MKDWRTLALFLFMVALAAFVVLVMRVAWAGQRPDHVVPEYDPAVHDWRPPLRQCPSDIETWECMINASWGAEQ